MNELDRMRKLAGILTEGVVAVPGVGSESNMQTSGNAARGANYAAFDAAQPGIDEMFDNMDEKAPPGMEAEVMDLKKEYPGEPSKAFATAWSIYNDKNNKTEEADMEECSTPMMEGGLDLEIQSAIEMLKDLEHNGYGPEEIVSTIEQSFRDDGFEDADIAQVMSAIQQHIEGGGEESDDEEGPYCSSCGGGGCPSCHGTGHEPGMKDPDDFNEPDEYDPADDWAGDMEEGFVMEETDEESVDEEEQVDESFDLNNGYDDITFMKPGDFFPDGADSPVISQTGPSGAKQGDNPEQKKMAVAETHKELVYNYRKFLKESAKK